MAKFFIHRPVLAMVISLVILIAGAVCIPNLPIAQYPDICPPVIQVVASYTGANAQVLEETVASPIEQQVNGCEGMLYMRSICTNQGTYILQITFDLSRDQDLAMVDVQNRVSQASPLLPVEVSQAGVSVKKQSTQNLVYISLYSEDGSRDSLFLSNYATINIIDQLARINGVGSASIMVGQRDYSMRLWVQPDKLAKLGVTCDDIISAVQSQSVQAAAGSIGDPPQPPGVAFTYPVNVHGRLTSPEEFGNIIISSAKKNSSFLRVRDVATTELGASTYNSSGERDAKESLIIAVYQQPSANGVALAQEIKAKMKELSKNFPSGVNYEITYDSTIFVTKSIEEVVHTLFEAIVLVLIVVLVFLGNLRATAIPILAVPVSLVGTFAGFALMGFSINLLTMFGLVLAVGIVVDDAIVVVEAVELHIEHGLSPIEATEKAMSEVSGPVVAIALVLCAVFVPVAFMGGMTGVMYKQFAITLSVSVVLSALVALTMTPALCAIILKPRKELRGPFGWFVNAFNGIFKWMTDIYVFLVRWSIKLVIPAAVLIAATYFGAYWMLTHTASGFIPNEDMGTVMISINLPSGASLERTAKAVEKVEAMAHKYPGVEHTLSLIGYNVIQGNQASNSGAVILVLKDWDERKKDSESAESIAMQIQKETSDLAEAQVIAICPPPVPGLSQTGGVTLELQDRSGGEIPALAQASNGYIGQVNKSGAVSMAYTLFNPSVPMLDVEVDRDKLINMGIPVSSAFTAMQVNLGGYYINQYNQFGRTWRVYMQADSKYRRNPSYIGCLYLRTSSGAMMPLSNVSSISEVTGPDVLIRYNLYRAVEINAEPAPGKSSGETIAAMEKMADSSLPQGYGYDWTSTAFQEKQASGQTVQILVLGLVFVFLFLAAQYESWGVPFAVLLSMPTVILGALVGIHIIGMDMNIYVQIGVLMLIGLSAKNAILIVEYAKANFDSGMDLIEATVEGARLRFRPILMTSFAFIMGVVPLAKAVGASAVCRRALGTSVMCGMLAATILGILIIPSLYVFVQGTINLFSGKKNKAVKSDDKKVGEVKAEAENVEVNVEDKAETEAKTEEETKPEATEAKDEKPKGDTSETKDETQK
ncbi:efflux RND transporter permease subunit [bacterium]|nr:efflux RND transporter permease subunit [bacterium]